MGTAAHESATPVHNATLGCMRRDGSGRFFVRTMFRSMSRSMYMLSAFAPDTISVVPSSVDSTRAGPRLTSRAGARLARKSPPAAVTSTMKVIRGFVSATRSRTMRPSTRLARTTS